MNFKKGFKPIHIKYLSTGTHACINLLQHHKSLFLAALLSSLNHKLAEKAIFNKCTIKSNHNTLRTQDMQPATRTRHMEGERHGVPTVTRYPRRQ